HFDRDRDPSRVADLRQSAQGYGLHPRCACADRRPRADPVIVRVALLFWPLHIAFLEMVIDPVCSIVFEAENEEPDTMRRPPRSPSAPLFTAGFVVWSLLQGVLVLALIAGLFVMALRQNLPEPDARSLAFA